MNYGDACTGIGAATLAWMELGWKAQWFSQHDPEHNYEKGPDFPSKVLQHHYPHVPNLGDMLKIRGEKTTQKLYWHRTKSKVCVHGREEAREGTWHVSMEQRSER